MTARYSGNSMEPDPTGLRPLPTEESFGALDVLMTERSHRRDATRLRQNLMTFSVDRVHVHAQIHTLAPHVERDISARLADLSDRLAILVHSVAEPGSGAEHARTAEQHRLLAARLADRLVDVDVTVGRIAASGPAWSLGDVPLAVLEQAQARLTALRLELVRTVDIAVDSGLLRTRDVVSASAGKAVPQFELTCFDADDVERIVAFATQARLLGAAAGEVRESLHVAALTGAAGAIRDWAFQGPIRRQTSRHALDRMRARHAAVAEIERISRISSAEAID